MFLDFLFLKVGFYRMLTKIIIHYSLLIIILNNQRSIISPIDFHHWLNKVSFYVDNAKTGKRYAN